MLLFPGPLLLAALRWQAPCNLQQSSVLQLYSHFTLLPLNDTGKAWVHPLSWLTVPKQHCQDTHADGQPTAEAQASCWR